MSDAVKKPIGDKIDTAKRQVKLVVGLLAGVFLLGLFAKGHFNSGGREETPTATTAEYVDRFEGHSMCVLGEPGCEEFTNNPDLGVVTIPEQGTVWCPPGSNECVEFIPEGGS